MTRHIIAAIIMLSLFAILAVSSLIQKSATCDEVAHHIPAGYSYFKKWDFRLNPALPPLSRYMMAFPLIFMNLEAPFDDKSWQEADTPVFGRKFFYEYNRKKASDILLFSRLPMVLIGVITGLILYIMASEFYDKKAGIFALFMFCLSPNILAHTRLATTEITTVCFILLSIYTFWRFLEFQSARFLLYAG